MQNTKSITAIVGVLVIVIALVIAGVQHAQKVDQESKVASEQTSAPSESVRPTTTPVAPKPTTTPTTSTTSTPTAGPKTYTAAQVATHSSQSDCWTIVNGGVYNLTSWVSKHPGGSRAILSMCGEDSSESFNEQHGGQGGPERVLASYKIGTLAK